MDLLNLPRLDKNSVKSSFNRAAKTYDDSAVLQEEVLSRLMQRLTYINHQAEVVVDIGCGTGRAIAGLRKQYASSRVFGLDLAHGMLVEARKRSGLFKKKQFVNADMENLPLATGCVDVVFSSLALQWCNDLASTFGEFKRVARPGGLLMFATFGVGTLSELRASWQQVDPAPRVHQFLDMHDIGDMLQVAGLSQPVMDREDITLEYERFDLLLRDLKAIGATNAERARSRGLMTARKLELLKSAYEQRAFENGRYQANYEVVYGHAWF